MKRRTTPKVSPTPTAAETVQSRDATYGGFDNVATTAQELEDVMRASPNWDDLSPYQKEGLKMVTHKIARLLNGDPNHIDSWHDIQGYALLVEKLTERDTAV